MTSARSTKIDLNITPYYHCMTRCVRRTFLCGKDFQTGRDYSHRKTWIVARIKQLVNIFAIKICAYAVMNNHYHLVIFVNEDQANTWNDDEVISRWAALFPRDAKSLKDGALSSDKIKQRLFILRQRLMNISWFMSCLNETIARRANQEENLSGRFWEGRFKSQALLDDGALLTAMAYVDLNPIRAKIAKTPEESEFTSIYDRIKAMTTAIKTNGTNKNTFQNNFSLVQMAKQCDELKQPSELMMLSMQSNAFPKIDFSFSDYLELIDSTGRILRDDKKGAIPDKLMPILFRLHLTPRGWIDMTTNFEDKFFHAVGNTKYLQNFGSSTCKKRNPKGINAAKQCYLQVA